MPYECDYLIIGSGFGGSVSALRLAEKGYKVIVVEQGKRWSGQNLPKTSWDLANWMWRPGLGLRGFFSLSFFKHLVVLHGNAVGGGSITYAATLLVPPDKVWNQGSWAGVKDWASLMPPHYETAKRMLGVETNRLLGVADQRLKAMAEASGCGSTFYPTEVGIFFGPRDGAPGTTYADPYFGGQGPERSSCIGCGGCMMGCRHGAKNTLDRNYLYLAEKSGAQLLAETKVFDVTPLEGREDGSAGYAVEVVALSGNAKGKKQTIRCRGVIFAASSLGTQELLLRLKQSKSLPRISQALGQRVYTNAESLIGLRYPGSKEDLSGGIAIGSGIYLDQHTHIEVCRYPNGSDAMGLITTVMSMGRPGWRRITAWLAALLRLLLTRPATGLRMLLPWNWARETMIFLCMQTLEGHLTMRLKRHWFWPFSQQLATYGQKIPTFIPAANEFAAKAAQATGGHPMTSITEILFDIPMTAHCIGGAGIGRTPEDGVCDANSRVFGYRNMYICDGSAVSANLGVNPSLTIAALAEHAMSQIPPASEQTWCDAAAVTKA